MIKHQRFRPQKGQPIAALQTQAGTDCCTLQVREHNHTSAQDKPAPLELAAAAAEARTIFSTFTYSKYGDRQSGSDRVRTEQKYTHTPPLASSGPGPLSHSHNRRQQQHAMFNVFRLVLCFLVFWSILPGCWFGQAGYGITATGMCVFCGSWELEDGGSTSQ